MENAKLRDTVLHAGKQGWHIVRYTLCLPVASTVVIMGYLRTFYFVWLKLLF